MHRQDASIRPVLSGTASRQPLFPLSRNLSTKWFMLVAECTQLARVK
jgi:hypothetical protein